MIFPIRI